MMRSSLRHNSLVRFYVWFRRIKQSRKISCLKSELKNTQKAVKELKKILGDTSDSLELKLKECQSQKEKIEELNDLNRNLESELATTKKMLSDMMLWREKTNAQLRAEAEVFAIKHIQGRSNDNS